MIGKFISLLQKNRHTEITAMNVFWEKKQWKAEKLINSIVGTGLGFESSSHLFELSSQKNCIIEMKKVLVVTVSSTLGRNFSQ